MAAISVRGLDDDVTARLKVRAARHGRSMEAEAREILTEATRNDNEHGGMNLGEAIHQAFSAIGGVDLELPPRTELPRIPDLR